jgi:hypothetical protein
MTTAAVSATAAPVAATPVPPATPAADAVKQTPVPPASSGQPTATPPATPASPAASSQPADDKAKAPVADAAKPADPAAKPAADAAAGALKLPEGSLLNEADLEDIKAYAKEKGLTPEQTQQLVERESLAVGSYKESLELAHKERSEGWEKECREDKEFGGQKYPESSEAALRAVKTFFPDLADELNQTRYGSYPKLWKGLVKIGLGMKDDSVPTPTVPQGSQEDLPFHERLYGKDGFGGRK